MLGRSATSNFKRRKAASCFSVKPLAVQRATAVATISSSCSCVSELATAPGEAWSGIATAGGSFVVVLIDVVAATGAADSAATCGTLAAIHSGLACAVEIPPAASISGQTVPFPNDVPLVVTSAPVASRMSLRARTKLVTSVAVLPTSPGTLNVPPFFQMKISDWNPDGSQEPIIWFFAFAVVLEIGRASCMG